MNIEKVIVNYLDFVKITALSFDYYNYEAKELKDFLAFSFEKNIVDTDELNKDVIIDFIKWLKSKLVPNGNKTCNKKVASLKRALLYNEIPIDNLSKVKRLRTEEKHFEFLKDQEVQELQAYMKRIRVKGPYDLVEKILFSLYLDTGIRVSELLDIKTANVDLKNGSILLLHTKGYRQRYVFFFEYTKKQIKRLYELVGDKRPKNLFYNYNINKPMNYKHVRTIIERCERNTSLHFSSHVLRHTHATIMADNGMNLHVLQKLLGHSSITTTEVYLHASTKKLKESYMKTVKKSILNK